MPGGLAVQRGGGAKGLGRPLGAQGSQAGPAGAAGGAPLPAPREGRAPGQLGALGLGGGRGAALGGLSGQEGQGAGRGHLRPPEPPAGVLGGALCGDRGGASPPGDTTAGVGGSRAPIDWGAGGDLGCGLARECRRVRGDQCSVSVRDPEL